MILEAMKPRLSELSDNDLYELRDEVQTGKDIVFGKLDTGGIVRLLTRFDPDTTYAVFTAYKADQPRIQNVLRNRELREAVVTHNLNVLPFVGYWHEVAEGLEEHEKQRNSGIRLERAYMVVKPDSLSANEFKDTLFSVLSQHAVDSLIISTDRVVEVVAPFKQKRYYRFGNTPIGPHQLSGAFGEQVRGLQSPFYFLGVETGSGEGTGDKDGSAARFRKPDSDGRSVERLIERIYLEPATVAIPLMNEVAGLGFEANIKMQVMLKSEAWVYKVCKQIAFEPRRLVDADWFQRELDLRKKVLQMPDLRLWHVVSVEMDQNSVRNDILSMSLAEKDEFWATVDRIQALLE